MIYREICGILLKVSHRVAAAVHYVLDQRIGMIYGGPGIVHEARSAPGASLRCSASGLRP